MALSLVVRNGMLYDGLGNPGRLADVGIDGDRNAIIGDIDQPGVPSIDASGLAVAPGFINILSHGWASLQIDGSGPSELLQGVTTEVFGEAMSPGPSSPAFLSLTGDLGDSGVRADFHRLSDCLDYMASRGLSMNVASFVGGHNLRAIAGGLQNRPLTAPELDQLRGVVDEEMAEGALGIGTALIYAPGNYASTDELTALAEVVGRQDGPYISHLRSEGDQFLECLKELITIGARAQCRSEVYHLKAAGTHNHHEMELAIEGIDAARATGQKVGANMYPYTAGATALAFSIPADFHEGGPAQLARRLGDPAVRSQILKRLNTRSDEFENLFLGADSGRGIVLMSDLPDGTSAAGRFLVDVGAHLGISDPAEALLNILQRAPDIEAAYFMMSEDNVELGLRQPWVSLGSDAGTEGIPDPGKPGEPTHPRTYGTFARLLGHYCRDRQLFTLEEAIRKITSQPASVVHLADRGLLTPGAFADLAIFDPATVGDHATYNDPHQLAAGMRHVIVNGETAVADGVIQNARPGRRLRRAHPHPLIPAP